MEATTSDEEDTEESRSLRYRSAIVKTSCGPQSSSAFLRLGGPRGEGNRGRRPRGRVLFRGNVVGRPGKALLGRSMYFSSERHGLGRTAHGEARRRTRSLVAGDVKCEKLRAAAERSGFSFPTGCDGGGKL